MNQELQTQILTATQECNQAFIHFNELLEHQKTLCQNFRNSLTPEDVIGKAAIANRPHKWGALQNIRPHIIKENDKSIFQEKDGVTSIIPYFKHLEVYDYTNIIGFMGQFQDVHELLALDKANEVKFFNEDAKYIVLWAEDWDFDSEDESPFAPPALVYEYLIVKS